MTRIGLFGASGFIGQNLMRLFSQDGITCVDLNIRKLESIKSIANELTQCGITHVIYAIGKAHEIKKETAKVRSSYYKANVELARRVASACIQSEVRQMIYLSSSKVYGDLTLDNCVTESNVSSLLDLYGKTKFDGEDAVINCLRDTDALPIVIRMPLVYGRDVKGNLRTLMRMLNYSIPLPLKSINYNSRSMLSINNLYAFILHILSERNIDYQIFNLKDESDYSTFEIVNMLIRANKLKSFIFTVNPRFLRFILKLISKTAEEKLMCNHLISDKLARTELGWKPFSTKIDDFKIER